MKALRVAPGRFFVALCRDRQPDTPMSEIYTPTEDMDNGRASVL